MNLQPVIDALAKEITDQGRGGLTDPSSVEWSVFLLSLSIAICLVMITKRVCFGKGEKEDGK